MQRGKDRKKRTSGLRRLFAHREGAFAIEFGILAIPFLLLIFAIFETFTAYAAESVVASAVDNLSRKIRTGEITFARGKVTDMTETQFRQAVCDEISVIISCSSSEASSPSRLYVDVKQYASYAAMPRAIPRVSSSPTADLNPSGFTFSPGGPGTINMIRIYYRWRVITDFMRPYITNLRPEGQAIPTDYLIMSTATIQNENYE